MNKTLLTIALSLVAGMAMGALAVSANQAETDTAASAYFDSSATAGERIEVLERIVAEERDARLVLEEQMQGLYSDLERLDSPELRELLEQLSLNQQQEEMRRADQQRARQSEVNRRSSAMRNYKQMRTDRLVSGGFSENRAKQILAIEDEIRMDLLQAEYEARRGGNEQDYWDRASNYQGTLRDRLGESDYEKYIVAQGGQASIMVSDVIGTSPASRAGLKPGDRIVSYDGNRVYSMWELKNQAFDGDQGEDVIVDIERDGQRMQLVMPRGPLGITGNGANIGSRGMFGG
jgi:TolA-binding protein